MTPFEVVYGFNPTTPMEFTPLPPGDAISMDGEAKAEYVKRLHQKVKDNLEKRTEQYTKHANKSRRNVVFNEGDWVWLHLRPERFPQKRKSKLAPRGDGPFRVLRRINDNAYQLELPGEFNVSTTFNVADLELFDAGEEFALETKALQEGGNDEDIVPATAPEVPPGPLTRAKARALEHKFNQLAERARNQESETEGPPDDAAAQQGPFMPDKDPWRFLLEDSSTSGVFTITIR